MNTYNMLSLVTHLHVRSNQKITELLVSKRSTSIFVAHQKKAFKIKYVLSVVCSQYFGNSVEFRWLVHLFNSIIGFDARNWMKLHCSAMQAWKVIDLLEWRFPFSFWWQIIHVSKSWMLLYSYLLLCKNCYLKLCKQDRNAPLSLEVSKG